MFQKIKKRKRRDTDTAYEYAEHASTRIDSRNISEEEIKRVLQFGKKKHQGGRILVFYRGMKVVLSGDGATVITAYKRASE